MIQKSLLKVAELTRITIMCTDAGFEGSSYNPQQKIQTSNAKCWLKRNQKLMVAEPFNPKYFTFNKSTALVLVFILNLWIKEREGVTNPNHNVRN